MIYEIKQHENIEHLFKGLKETIIWSCLQQIMGHLYANDAENPTSAMAILGDFCFFAGKPDKEMVAYKPEWCEQKFIIMVPPDEAWAKLIEGCYRERAKKIVRYATKKEPDVFCMDRLQKAAEALPDDYIMKMMDEGLFNYCRTTEWCKDLVAQYRDYKIYSQYGIGVMILKDGEPVSGASSYSGYRNGIEIEIDTKEEYRRKGLAYICGAELILKCLERGWYPSWDAHNRESLALAEKLGYHLDYEYPAYEIWGY